MNAKGSPVKKYIFLFLLSGILQMQMNAQQNNYSELLPNKKWQRISNPFPNDSVMFMLNTDDPDVEEESYKEGFVFNSDGTISNWISGHLRCDIGHMIVQKSSWTLVDNKLLISMSGKMIGYDDFNYKETYFITDISSKKEIQSGIKKILLTKNTK